MFKKYQMVILTVLIPLVIYKIISLLFESSVIDAIVVENGIEVMAYCFIKSKIMTSFAITILNKYQIEKANPTKKVMIQKAKVSMIVSG